MGMDRRSLSNDPEEALRLAFEDMESNLWTACPAIVTKVDLTKMTLECQPTIKGQVAMEDNTTQYVNMPILADVPIVFPSAGGFMLTLPIAVGDEVLVVFGARCIDSWWDLGGIQVPAEVRMHDLSDGFAIPGPRSKPKLPAGAISSTGAQLRNNLGTTYIEIAANGKIKLVSPSSIEVTGDLNVSGDVVAGTVSLKTHIHSGVQTGGGDSGPPVP